MKQPENSICAPVRCHWVNLKNPVYVRYHDREWGKPVVRDRKHFEMLTLEGAQAGLSWETVLKKREAYRTLFEGFDPRRIARFSDKKLEQILSNNGVIRNRRKIYSVRENAKAFLSIQKERGSFNRYVWEFVGGAPIDNCPRTSADFQSSSPESDILSRDLKRRGFSFVGSTIIYAYLQAAGLVNDHSYDCFVRRKR
ncbi:MAG: DNA-3-methyladenine glycosylase I [Bdellovibrionales bacterium]|nr:DNA-3-methyladenine glycosylase I [Bdellovibrionales bacterium]